MVGEIRALTFDDEDEIIGLIKACIFNGDELHIGDLVANDENVWAFYKLEIFSIIFEDYPIFGYFDRDKLLGLACCSTKINELYQLKQKTATGVITMTHPDHRLKGIATKLRIHIGKQLHNQGISKFIFEIKNNNQASLKNAQKIAEKLKAQTNLLSFKFEGSTNVF
ncbi:MAG: hypothetical protein CL833_05870 [Crocinitomicaceae bacterium]|nr:hypothetical protein [Crocinitomicaceae bacterium]